MDRAFQRDQIKEELREIEMMILTKAKSIQDYKDLWLFKKILSLMLRLCDLIEIGKEK
jgi:hypothetical protein